MHVLILTAGGAGMFCGSCMHDNTWARALISQGHEVTLLPTFTPITVDETDESNQHVFLGGINIYLDHRFPLWKRAPRFLKNWFDSPLLLKLVSQFSASQDASQLGPLTLAMLDGEAGPLVAEMDQLVQFINQKLKPDLICFSNALLVGILKRLKTETNIPICCVLQGDDIFLEGLLPEFRTLAIKKVSEQSQQFDRFLVHSKFYRDFMIEYLSLEKEKTSVLPLGIDLEPYAECEPRQQTECTKLGYFARIAPEKGLHNLVEAYLQLLPEFPELELIAGGYLAKRNEPYLEALKQKVSQAGGKFQYAGSPEQVSEKVKLYQQFDLFSVPTDYLEPKGISVLEAMASGLPVVQPDHGAFPEILQRTEGGLLADSHAPQDLAQQLKRLLNDGELRKKLAQNGYHNVRKYYSAKVMADCSNQIFEACLAESALKAD